MKRWLFTIFGCAIASVLVLNFPQEALSQLSTRPGISPGQMRRLDRPNVSKQNQGASANEQTAFIGKTYNVNFADKVHGNNFTAHFNFPSTNTLEWQYYWDNSPKGPLNTLELQNNSDRTFNYYRKQNNGNGDPEESIFTFSFSNDFSTFEGIGNFVWHLKNGEINNRQYSIKGQSINR